MKRSRPFPAGPSRAAVAAFLACTFLWLGGCSALEGALVGGFFGAVVGDSAEAMVAGAVVGAGVGAVLDSHERGYWYQDYNCPPPPPHRRSGW